MISISYGIFTQVSNFSKFIHIENTIEIIKHNIFYLKNVNYE